MHLVKKKLLKHSAFRLSGIIAREALAVALATIHMVVDDIPGGISTVCTLCEKKKRKKKKLIKI